MTVVDKKLLSTYFVYVLYVYVVKHKIWDGWKDLPNTEV